MSEILANPFGPDPEKRQRIVDAVVKQLRQNHPSQREAHVLVTRANAIVEDIYKLTDEVLRADTGGLYDSNAMRKLVTSMAQQGFSTWSKDEMLGLLCIMHAELMMDVIDEKARMGLTGEHMDKPI